MEPIEIDLPWRRSPDELADGLSSWARATLGADATVTEVAAPQGSGMSSETVLFRLGGTGRAGRYVARLAPDPRSYPVFPDYDLGLQQRCMALVAERTAVPVPSCPWLEPDPSWLGAPFLVMGRVDGVAPADVPPYTMTGWMQDLGTADRAVLQLRVIETMAALHAVDAESADLSFLYRPQHGASPLDQHLGYQRWYFDWARGDVDYPLVERAFAWLHDHRPPADGPTVLNWGDARIGNVLFDGTEPTSAGSRSSPRCAMRSSPCAPRDAWWPSGRPTCRRIPTTSSTSARCSRRCSTTADRRPWSPATFRGCGCGRSGAIRSSRCRANG